MKLFGFPLSPFVRKVAVVLAEKGQEFEWEPTNPRVPSEEFSKASPFGKIPAFSDGDYRLADSTAIVIYLEARLPSVPLLAVEARARGREVFFDEIVDTILVPAAAPIVVNRFLKPVIFGEAGDEEAALAAEESVKRPLDYLEAEAAAHGWLNGQYGLGDIALCSVIKTLGYTGWSLDAAAYPSLAALYGRVGEREAWQAVAAREAAMFAASRG
ncbi:MAG: glutathione S-transferase family protein [Alteraurantiacibacter sp.]